MTRQPTEGGDDPQPSGRQDRRGGKRAPAEVRQNPRRARTRTRTRGTTATVDDETREAVEVALVALAAGRMHDPADALVLIDVDQFDLSTRGEPDIDDIAGAVDELLEERPYLASDARRGGFQGGADQGARVQPGKLGQLRQEDLAGMTPKAIVAAKQAGRLDELLGRRS